MRSCGLWNLKSALATNSIALEWSLELEKRLGRRFKLLSSGLWNPLIALERSLELAIRLINDIYVNSFAAVARCDALRFLSVYVMALSCAFV